MKEKMRKESNVEENIKWIISVIFCVYNNFCKISFLIIYINKREERNIIKEVR